MQGKWLSDKALQMTDKRREAKSKGERGRYTQLIQSSREH